MGWIDDKLFRLILPSFNDEFVRCKTFESFKSFGKIVCIHKSRKMAFELLMSVIIIALYGGFFESTIHALDLPIRPGMVHFCKAVLDLMFMAHSIKDMHPGILIHLSVRKLNAVIREDGVDFVGYHFDKVAEKLSRFCLPIFF